MSWQQPITAITEAEMLLILRGMIGRPDAGKMRASEMAHRAGLSTSYVSEVLAGKKSVPAQLAMVAGYKWCVGFVPATPNTPDMEKVKP